MGKRGLRVKKVMTRSTRKLSPESLPTKAGKIRKEQGMGNLKSLKRWRNHKTPRSKIKRTKLQTSQRKQNKEERKKTRRSL